VAAPDQVWTLTHEGREHRVVAGRNAAHLVRWYVDDELVGERRTWSDKVTVVPREGEARLLVYYSGLGAPRRATLYPAGEAVGALARLGGTDLVPARGSAAERYDERLLEHPHRYAALAAVGGAAKVLVPILLSVLAVHLAIRIPWPHVPFPDLPSVPWPDVPTPGLPDWHLPQWVRWLLDKVKYVWPVVFAVVVARAEVRRRRQRSVPPDVSDAGPHERAERPRR
jgi:hypothetical protein